MTKTDITFAYNANFFLFATLENARPIAQGRVSGQAPNCPVLTGVPVAGIAYLDRPAQAGYFIFPDLSVRHEGYYRLNFNLYEEVKDAKDVDKETPMPSQQSQVSSGKPTAPKAFLNFRLEVKSAPFQVYSAKKFPGLATSTSLSRVVAEQGCRVRIRRDVRMRRRGEKSSKDYAEYDEERAYGRPSSRYTTPTPVERPRSASASSAVDPPYAYPQTPRRDSSSHEYSGYQAHHPIPPPPPAASTPYQHASHPHPAPPPPPSSSSSGIPGYLSFGSTPASYQAPQLPAAPPPPPHRAYTPGSSTPKSYSSHASLPHSRHASSSSEHESVPISYPTRSHNLPSILNPAPMEPVVTPSSSENYHSAASTPTSATAPQRPRTPSSSIMLPPISSFASSVPPPPPHSSSQHPSDNLHQRRPSYYPIETSLAKRSHEDSFGSYDAIAHHKSIRSTESDYAGVNANNNNANAPNPAGPMSKRGPVEVDEPQWDRPQMEYRRADGRMSSKLQLAV
jgi:Velvet factor